MSNCIVVAMGQNDFGVADRIRSSDQLFVMIICMGDEIIIIWSGVRCGDRIFKLVIRQELALSDRIILNQLWSTTCYFGKLSLATLGILET